ncbi:sulfotransferase family protein [Roseiconus lacunae]|uniref:Sulfotransferase n=1 Tax=Roseiconus lacunae TaxID=2605694 RepID=A0ABT7PR08_9BACT|nr:sulfotransferase family protein [Roseiconus lacunae]MCD0460341.1 hypothetical protein [Roseiconus lacunae]MDM4018944.1 sulfotransferase [Roseiconus lacunae]WRQ51833.1 sulfotransferase [Stieleria sp. HD01]
MKIFCTGLSRTGTTSICEGFRALGLRACHFPFAIFGQPEKIGEQQFKPQLSRGLRARWQLHRELKALRCHDPLRILEQNDAFSDLPVPLYFERFEQQYPDAKFIHTTRPVTDWISSMRWLLDRGRYEKNWTVGELADEMHFSVYGCTEFDEIQLTKAWSRHENRVHDYFASRSDKLLVLDISRGDLSFDKIAPFLEMSVPSEPFPSSNAKN